MTLTNIESIKKVLGNAFAEDQIELKISLFVISSKNHRIKSLDLHGLTSKQRIEKLTKVGQEFRFVAVVELGDSVFAHTSSKFAEQLKKQDDLNLNGKKITVNALTDEEFERLSTVVIEEAIAEQLTSNPKDEKESKVKSVDKGVVSSKHSADLEQKPLNNLFSIHGLIKRMAKNNLVDVILKNWSESQRDWQKQGEIENKRRVILEQEIKKEIFKSEIKKEEVEKQNQKSDRI